jgi:alcohol dehydrogenase YqhD (iron-dependent ADH family)
LAHNDLVGCGRTASAKARAGGWESHALEHELSAIDPKITHGAGLAVVMPAWMRYVADADPSRFAKFGHDVFGVDSDGSNKEAVVAAALETIDRLQAFFVSMGMPSSLKDFNLDISLIDRLLDGLEKSKGSIFGAFKSIGRQDARVIYESAF